MIQLFILRGLPGSGKSTLAKSLADQVFAADDYFTHGEEYRRDPTRLKEAHEECLKNTRKALIDLVQEWRWSELPLFPNDKRMSVAVTNVFSKKVQIEPYAALMRDPSVIPRHPDSPHHRTFVIDLFDQNMSDAALSKHCVHGVPAGKISKFRLEWEH